MSQKFIKKERAKQLLTQNLLQTLVYYRSSEEKSKFEQEITKIIKRNKLKQRLDQLNSQYDILLEERRQALDEVLKQDNERYRRELEQLVPTPEQQVQAMRIRVNELRAKKETQRQKFVAEKLMQQWRSNCDDLRGLTSKMMDKQVSAVRDNQLIELSERKQKIAVEKKHYEQLWEQDRLKKIAREEQDKLRQKMLHDQAAAILVEQVKELAEKKKEEARLKEEEAKLMIQRLEMDKQAAVRNEQIKAAQQQLVRADLDRFNKKKILEKQKQAQTALEADLKMLEELAELDQRDREERSRRKVELRKQALAYRDYLLEQKKEAIEFEKQLDSLYQEQAEKMWRMRAERWSKEQTARDRLMKEVVAVRQQQVAEAIERNRQKQEQIKLEKQAIEKSISEYEAEEGQKKKKYEQKMIEYQNALSEQLRDVYITREKEKEKQLLEIEAEKEADVRYRQLLETEMNRIRNMPMQVIY